MKARTYRMQTGAGEKQDTASDQSLVALSTDHSSSRAFHMDGLAPRGDNLGAEETMTGCGYTLTSDLRVQCHSGMDMAEMKVKRCGGVDCLQLETGRVSASPRSGNSAELPFQKVGHLWRRHKNRW
jgi:hypothetical protein